jgi:hypothetical protein
MVEIKLKTQFLIPLTQTDSYFESSRHIFAGAPP